MKPLRRDLDSDQDMPCKATARHMPVQRLLQCASALRLPSQATANHGQPDIGGCGPSFLSWIIFRASLCTTTSLTQSVTMQGPSPPGGSTGGAVVGQHVLRAGLVRAETYCQRCGGIHPETLDMRAALMTASAPTELLQEPGRCIGTVAQV
jgi:hypothetical protein